MAVSRYGGHERRARSRTRSDPISASCITRRRSIARPTCSRSPIRVWQVTPNRDANYLLDLTPRSDSWTDADLAFGKSFVGFAGITISVGAPVNGRLPVTVTR
jgi:hypothetical protein